MASVTDFSVQELKQYLLQNGVSVEIANNFEKNCVSGASFVKLTEDDIASIIGVRTIIRDLLRQSKAVSSNIIAF